MLSNLAEPKKTGFPQPGPRRLFVCIAAFLLLVLAGPAVHAQGCSQCLDSTRATPPQVQAAYRHAIYVLGGAGCAFFVAGGLLLRKHH